MGKALFKGTLLGAIVIYLWMMVSWMILPWHCSAMNKFSNESTVRDAILENSTRDGIYVLPNICDPTYMQRESESLKNGPMVFAAIQRHGFDVGSPAPYLISFVTDLITAFLLTLLLLLSNVLGYGKRVVFITLLGLTVGLATALPNWNWWGFSASFTLVQILDMVISFLLAGLVIAAVAKQRGR